jgi:hypothetical protein
MRGRVCGICYARTGLVPRRKLVETVVAFSRWRGGAPCGRVLALMGMTSAMLALKYNRTLMRCRS